MKDIGYNLMFEMQKITAALSSSEKVQVHLTGLSKSRPEEQDGKEGGLKRGPLA